MCLSADQKWHTSAAVKCAAGVLGANDGLVSVASLMMGVGGGTKDVRTLVLSGLSGLVGGALSMAGEAWTDVITAARKTGFTERKRCLPGAVRAVSPGRSALSTAGDACASMRGSHGFVAAFCRQHNVSCDAGAAWMP